ncbi:MAG TPA: PAS domain S-box protein [Anaerolineales bacterium]|nr:PAS domain S-box protein [Anaerolineales bacterium]
MSQPLRVLILEDNPADVELCLHALRNAGYDVSTVHVDDAETFRAHLDDEFDLIIADYALPNFDARRALALVKEKQIDAPFLVVSGTIGEDIAVQMIQSGASDYLLKDRLVRLGAAVEQALEQRRLRRENTAIEAALRAQDRFFRAVVEHATEGLALLKRDLTLSYLSPNAERMTGWRAEAFPGRDPLAVVHTEDQADARRALMQALEHPRQVQRVDVRMRRHDGVYRWVECAVDNQLDQPDVQAVVVNMRDIDARRRAEEALRASEENYRVLFDHNPQPMWVYDRESLAIQAVNFAAVEAYGYSTDEFLRMSILDLHAPDIHSRLLEVTRSLPGKIRRPGVWRQRRKDGSWLDVEIVTHDLTFEGRPARLVMANDVTDREHARLELEASERRYRQLSEEAPIGIYRTAPDGRILFVNPALCQMLGYDDAAELMLRNLEATGSEADYARDDFKRRLEADGEIRGLESVWTRKDGSRLFIRENARVVRGQNGDGTYYEGTVEDITERKKGEDELRRRSEEVLQLYQAGRALGETLEQEALFDGAYQAVARVMDCSGFYISTYEAETNTIRSVYARHNGTKVDASEILSLPLEPEGQGTQSRVIRSGESLYLPDCRAFWRNAGTRFLVEEDGVLDQPAPNDADIDRSALIVPLKLEEKVTGVVQVFSSHPNAFQPDQMHFLEALAPQLAAAMANARLFRRAQEEIRERRQAEQAVRLLSEFNEGIIRNMSEGIVLEEPDETFSFVNPAAASLLGYTAEELTGRHLSTIIPPDQVAVVRAANARRAEGESDRYELQLQRKDGTRISVLVSGSPRFQDGELEGTIAVFTDITELKEAQRDVARRAEVMQALYQTSLEINAQPSLQTVLQAIVERAASLLGVQAGGLYLLRPDGETLEMAVVHGMLAEYQGTSLRRGQGLSGQVLESGQTMSVEDYTVWPDRSSVYERGHFRRVLAVPLTVGHKIVGVLNAADLDKAGAFTPEEIRLAELFADQAAIAVENARLLEDERERSRALEALYQISIDITAQADLPRLLETTVRRAMELLHVGAGALALVQSDGETLKFVVGYGFGDELVGSERKRGMGLSGRAFDTGRPFAVEDYSQFDGRTPGLEGAGRVLAVPLRVGGRSIGVLNLGDMQRKGSFEEEEVRLAELIADQAAIAVENARLLEAERRRATYLEGVTTVSKALRAAASRNDMLPIINAQLARLLRTPHLGIALTVSDQEVEIQAGEGVLASLVGQRGNLSDGLVGEILSTGSLFLTNDASREARIVSRELFQEASCVVGMPLVSQDRRIGVVIAARPTPFTDDEIRLLTAIAEMAGNALNRAGLMETLEQRVAERTADLAAANARLQELDQLKSAFVSNVSHELRSPITNIQLYLDLLEQPGREGRRPTYMGILRGESGRLHRLIEDLLTLSRLERGAVALDLEPQVLDALIAEVVSSHEARAHHKGIELRHELNPGAPLVPAAHGPIVQVLTNLIGNAVAYAPQAAIVTVSTRQEDSRGTRYAAVRVHNSQPDIPEEDLPHLFERFYRGKTGRESGETGTGLGLAICKEIVERHRGWIDVESAPQTGTAFTVWLPLDEAATS